MQWTETPIAPSGVHSPIQPEFECLQWWSNSHLSGQTYGDANNTIYMKAVKLSQKWAPTDLSSRDPGELFTESTCIWLEEFPFRHQCLQWHETQWGCHRCLVYLLHAVVPGTSYWGGTGSVKMGMWLPQQQMKRGMWDPGYLKQHWQMNPHFFSFFLLAALFQCCHGLAIMLCHSVHSFSWTPYRKLLHLNK